MMPQSTEEPHKRASRIEHFVIQYIYNQEFVGKDGATIKTLVDVLLEEFCNDAALRDEDSPRKERMEMRNAIRIMASKQLLKQIQGSEPVAFTIHPSVDVRKYLPKPLSTQRSVEVEQGRVTQEHLLEEPIGQEEEQSVQRHLLEEPIDQEEEQSVQRGSPDKPRHTIIVDVGNSDAQGFNDLFPEIQRSSEPPLEYQTPRLELESTLQKRQDDIREEVLSTSVPQVQENESSRQVEDISAHAQMSPPTQNSQLAIPAPRQQPRKPRSRAGLIAQGPLNSYDVANASQVKSPRLSRRPLGPLDPNSLPRKRREENGCPKAQVESADGLLSASKIIGGHVRDFFSVEQEQVRKDLTVSIRLDGSAELCEDLQREDGAKLNSEVQSIRPNSVPEVQMQCQANSSAESPRGMNPESEVESGPGDYISYAEIEDDSKMDLDAEPDSSQPIRTPSRKRQRIMEITASESSSSFDPISPVRWPNSTNRRPFKRLCTPQSDPRRQSAPSRIFSPAKVRSPRMFQHIPDTIMSSLKHEKKPDNSPAWLKQAAEALRNKFPLDSFETEDGQVRCLVCDRSFKPGSNGSLSGLQAHLNGKPHKAEREKRADTLLSRESQGPVSTMDHASKDLDFNYSLPQEPLAVYVHQNDQNTLASMRQYHADVEASFRLRTIQGHHLEHSYRTLEKRTKDQIDEIEASIAASDRANLEKHRNMLEMVASLEEQTTDQLVAVDERIDTTDARMEDATERIEVVISHVKEIQKTTSDNISDMFSKLARSDLRNIEQIEDVKEAQKKLDFRANSWEQNNARIETLAEEQRKLDLKAKEREQKSWRRFQDASVKIDELGKIAEIQSQTIQRLKYLVESQAQHQSEQAERQQESEQAFKKAIADQMEAQSQQFEKRIATMKREYATRFGMLKEQFSDRLKDVEEKHSSRIQSLEKEKAKLKARIKVFDKTIPLIFEDSSDLRRFCQEEFEKRPPRVAKKSAGASPAKDQRNRQASPIL